MTWRYLTSPGVILLGTLLVTHASAQEKREQSAAVLERAATVKRLAQEILTRTQEDVKRVTKEYAENRLSGIRRVVQEQVLETLNQSGSPDDVRETLRAVLGTSNLFGENPRSPFVYKSNLQGVEVLVTGYEWAYGGVGVPWIKVMIDGYRKVGLRYELAAETGEGLEGCDLVLDRLSSPRPNEAWFLAYGHIIGASRYLQPVRIYSFDQYEFKVLWDPGQLKMDPSFEIDKDAVTITYHRDGDREHLFRDIVALSTGGPVVSTSEVASPAAK